MVLTIPPCSSGSDPNPGTHSEVSPHPLSQARTLAEFGVHLEQVRKSKGLSLRQAAAATQGTPSHVTIRDWEKGARSPRRCHLYDLLTRAYGFTDADALTCIDAVNSIAVGSTETATRHISVHGRPPNIAAAWQPRRAIQDRLRTIWDSATPGATSMVALHGPGGVGKTQIAASAFFDEHDPATLRVWVDATNRESVMCAFAYAGQHTPEVQGSATDTTADWAQHFLHWLANTSQPWLMVIDNLVDWECLAPLPQPGPAGGNLWPTGNGRVLITTRYRGPNINTMGVHSVAVPVFTAEEAQRFLAMRLSPALVGDDTLPANALDAAAELCEHVHRFPLALAHAGASIEAMGLTCSQYLASLQKTTPAHHQPLWQDAGLSTHYLGAVGSTWRVAAGVANTMHPQRLALPTLYLASVIGSMGMPVEFWHSKAATSYLARHGETQGAPISRDDVRVALRLLHQLSLVSHRPDANCPSVRIDAFTQYPIRAALASMPSSYPTVANRQYASLLDETVGVAAQSIAQIWPERELDTILGASLRAHVAALCDHQSPALGHDDASGALYLVGASFLFDGRYQKARSAFATTASWVESTLGVDHPSALIYRMYESCAKGWGGEHLEAYDELLQRHPVLVDAVGEFHRETLWCVTSAAMFAHRAGNLDAACELMERAHQGLAKHVPTDGMRYNAMYWSSLFRYELDETQDSLQHYLDTEILATAQCGPNDPITLLAREAHYEGIMHPAPVAMNLAHHLEAMRRQHGGTANAMLLVMQHKIGFALMRRGEYAKAREVFEGFIPVMSAAIGPQHADVLWCRVDLAEVRRNEGQVEQAQAELADLYPQLCQTLGADHPRTLWCEGELAWCHLHRGDAAAAEATFRRVAEDLAEVRGTFHPDTLLRRHHHAIALLALHRREEAIDVLRAVLDDLVTTRGEANPRVADVRRTLEEAEQSA